MINYLFLDKGVVDVFMNQEHTQQNQFNKL